MNFLIALTLLVAALLSGFHFLMPLSIPGLLLWAIAVALGIHNACSEARR